jgi:hypothetical protein
MRVEMKWTMAVAVLGGASFVALCAVERMGMGILAGIVVVWLTIGIIGTMLENAGIIEGEKKTDETVK